MLTKFPGIVCFPFYLKKLNDKNKKSAILALFQASLDQANQGEIEINQNSHFQKIMVRSKMDEKQAKIL